MTTSTKTSVVDLLKAGKVNELLNELSDVCQRSEVKSGKAAQHAMIAAYQVAMGALENPDLWDDICSNPRWADFRRRPKREQQDNPLQAVIRLSVGFGGPRFDKIVSVRYRALQPLLSRRQPAATVRRLLQKHGGAEGLIAHERKRVAKQNGESPASEKPSATKLIVEGLDPDETKKFVKGLVVLTVRLRRVDRAAIHAKLLKSVFQFATKKNSDSE